MTDQKETEEIENSKAPLIEHLVELRSRLLKTIVAIAIAFLVCFFFASDIFNILIIPYERAVGSSRTVEMIFTAPQEYFFTQVKLALFGAIFIAFPVLATQVYMFVAPGLYKKERDAFLPFLVATPILFIIGACLVFFLIMPLAMMFFLSMEQTGEGVAHITHLPKVSEYLGLIMTLIFAFGLVFQLPVLLTILAKVGFVDSAWLKTKRKYAVVVAFIMAAFLTPPDPMSQLGLAVPTLLLYEASIYAVKWVEKKRVNTED